MKRNILAALLVTGLCVGTASAQFGGVVYDPTNYANAVLRYKQLIQQLAQLKQTYTQIVQQYNLAVQMARNLQNMPARYRAQFSQWRNVVAPNTYGNTGTWVNGMNTGLPGSVNTGYQQVTTPLLQFNGQFLSGMTPDELNRVKSQYASVELSDGSNVTADAACSSPSAVARNGERKPMTSKFKHTYAEQNALLRDLRQILEHGDEREFMKVLRKHGIHDEDSRFAEIVKMFRALRSGKT